MKWINKLKKELGETEVFIWDEASMIPQTVMTILDRTFWSIYTRHSLGNILYLRVIFVKYYPWLKKAAGDKYSRRANFGLFEKHKFTINMRAVMDKTGFADWLLDIGDNKMKRLDVTEDLMTDNVINESKWNYNSRIITASNPC